MHRKKSKSQVDCQPAMFPRGRWYLRLAAVPHHRPEQEGEQERSRGHISLCSVYPSLQPAVLHVMAVLMVDRSYKMQQRAADHPDVPSPMFSRYLHLNLAVHPTRHSFGSLSIWHSTARMIQVFPLCKRCTRTHYSRFQQIHSVCYDQRWRCSTAICTWTDCGRSRVAYLRHRCNA